jgi:DNA-directed RNA polymerase specialized sigma24 family protein
VETVDLENIAGGLVASSNKPAGTPAFEFHHWMTLLESREREALTLRFVEDWEYHEIAAAKEIPIGTVQWRVFNAKKKLAPHLKARENSQTRSGLTRGARGWAQGLSETTRIDLPDEALRR